VNRRVAALSPALVDRVLQAFGFRAVPTRDLAGLTAVNLEYRVRVPFDNIQKRIWQVGSQSTPPTGGDPTQFFENWLAHGTGGTCWPTNGALAALLAALGFDVRQIAGEIVIAGWPHRGNHGSMIVTLDGAEYLVDGNIGALAPLPLIPGAATSTGQGLHDISAIPREDGWDVVWRQTHSRQPPLVFRTDRELDPVDQRFFAARNVEFASVGLFNQALYIARRWPDHMLTLGRQNKISVSDREEQLTEAVPDTERKRVLVEEMGVSEEIAEALPPDVPGAPALL
jgi:arylamine N-acetyltransferase